MTEIRTAGGAWRKNNSNFPRMAFRRELRVRMETGEGRQMLSGAVLLDGTCRGELLSKTQRPPICVTQEVVAQRRGHVDAPIEQPLTEQNILQRPP
jgi:hypothetical protein